MHKFALPFDADLLKNRLQLRLGGIDADAQVLRRLIQRATRDELLNQPRFGGRCSKQFAQAGFRQWPRIGTGDPNSEPGLFVRLLVTQEPAYPDAQTAICIFKSKRHIHTRLGRDSLHGIRQRLLWPRDQTARRDRQAAVLAQHREQRAVHAQDRP